MPGSFCYITVTQSKGHSRTLNIQYLVILTCIVIHLYPLIIRSICLGLLYIFHTHLFVCLDVFLMLFDVRGLSTTPSSAHREKESTYTKNVTKGQFLCNTWNRVRERCSAFMRKNTHIFIYARMITATRRMTQAELISIAFAGVGKHKWETLVKLNKDQALTICCEQNCLTFRKALCTASELGWF